MAKKVDKKDRIRKRDQLMVYFIAGIMVSSIFGVMFYGFTEQGGKATYGKYKFKQNPKGWITKIDGNELLFTYNPNQVGDIELSDEVKLKISSSQLIVTSSFEDEAVEAIALAQFDMAEVGSVSEVYLTVGFTDYETEIMPMIGCENATQFVPVIYFKSSNETKVSLEGNCIVAESKTNDGFLVIKDRLLYYILGIMD